MIDKDNDYNNKRIIEILKYFIILNKKMKIFRRCEKLGENLKGIEEKKE